MKDLRTELMEKPLYECKVCGVSLANSATWCDLGCGRDYNEMREITGAGKEWFLRPIIRVAEQYAREARIEELEDEIDRHYCYGLDCPDHIKTRERIKHLRALKSDPNQMSDDEEEQRLQSDFRADGKRPDGSG